MLEKFFQHLNQNFWLLSTRNHLLVAVGLSELREVEPVLVLFVLELADLLDLVVVDLQAATHKV